MTAWSTSPTTWAPSTAWTPRPATRNGSTSTARRPKGSPVLADGKIYIADVASNFLILKPGENSCEEISNLHFRPKNDVPVTIFGSPSILHGRVYFMTADNDLLLRQEGASHDGGRAAAAGAEGDAGRRGRQAGDHSDRAGRRAADARRIGGPQGLRLRRPRPAAGRGQGGLGVGADAPAGLPARHHAAARPAGQAAATSRAS